MLGCGQSFDGGVRWWGFDWTVCMYVLYCTLHTVGTLLYYSAVCTSMYYVPLCTTVQREPRAPNLRSKVLSSSPPPAPRPPICRFLFPRQKYEERRAFGQSWVVCEMPLQASHRGRRRGRIPAARCDASRGKESIVRVEKTVRYGTAVYRTMSVSLQTPEWETVRGRSS